MRRISFSVGSATFWLWAGAWSVWDRSGGALLSNRQCAWLSNRQCACHRFTLFVGPFGVEIGEV